MTRLFIHTEEIEITDSFLNSHEQVEFHFNYVFNGARFDSWPAPDNDEESFPVVFDLTLQCSYLIDEAGLGQTTIDAVLVHAVQSSKEEYQSYFETHIDHLEQVLVEMARSDDIAELMTKDTELKEFNFDDYRN